MAADQSYPISVKAGLPVLGVLPNGWEQKSLDSYLTLTQRKCKVENEEEYDLVTVKRSRGGVVRREHLLGSQISVKSQFYLQEGDFLISKRQIVHGACGLVPKELAGSIVSNEYAVFIARPNFYLGYLKYLSETLYFQQTCFHSSIGVHIEKMIFKLDRWFKWKFNVPPLDEQIKIVEILSTWDKAIDTTEKLLVNSQQQKKALMQKLLTGKKRLLDENRVRFSERWRKIKLKQCIKVLAGNAFKSESFKDSGIPILRISNIKKDFSIDLDDCIYHSEDQDLIRFKVVHGDIVIAMSGATTGKIGRYLRDSFCYLNQRVGKFEIKHLDADVNYIFHLLKLPSVQIEILIDAVGGAQPNISSNDIEKIKITIPSVKEQEEIAKVLSSADNEINYQQKKLNLLKQEKKALMRQLLTGKRRVNIN